MAASSTLPSSATAGSTMSPAVKLTDSRGRAVSGAAVTFEVTAGGGTVSNSTVQTNVNGIAGLPAWFLGTQPGTNTLVARHGSLTPVTFSVIVTDLDFRKFAGDNTTCPAGSTPGCRFAVQLLGANSSGVAGETVVWTGPGGASLTTTTGTGGFALAPNLGSNTATGSFTQKARVESSGIEVTFNYQIVTGGQYTIDIRYVGDISPSHQAAFAAAKQRWEQVITGNLAPVQLNIKADSACAPPGGEPLIRHPAINETVDDLLVFVQVDSIDGPGKILGQAGPCLIRSSTRLALLGMMRFDEADFNNIEANGLLQDVVTHELGHVLGFPNTWSDAQFLLLDTLSVANNPYYKGARGGSAFVLAGGTLVNAVGVPVENTGSTGTRHSHWRESVLSNELMTGFINSQGTAPRNPLSAITIGSLMDIGYQVNFGAADAYMLPGAGPSALRMDEGTRLEMIEAPMPPPRMIFSH